MTLGLLRPAGTQYESRIAMITMAGRLKGLRKPVQIHFEKENI